MSRLKSFITWPIAVVLAAFALGATSLLIWGPPEAKDPIIAVLGAVCIYGAGLMRSPKHREHDSPNVNSLVPLFLAIGIGASTLQGCGASSYDRHTIAVQGLQLTSMVAKDVVKSEFVGRLTHGEMPPTVTESIRAFDGAIAAYAIGVERYADGQLGSDDILPLALAAYSAFQDLLALLRAAGVDTSGIPLVGGVQ